ncbi:MAG: hypothetical protein ABI647_13555 [Gemmatimonadota bacterium]
MSAAHLNPEEAVRAFCDVGGAGVMVPLHWGTFKLTDEPVEEPPARAAAEWAARRLRPDHLWTLAHGQTRLLGAPGD